MTKEELLRAKHGVSEYIWAIQRMLHAMPDTDNEANVLMAIGMNENAAVAGDYYVLLLKAVQQKP